MKNASLASGQSRAGGPRPYGVVIAFQLLTIVYVTGGKTTLLQRSDN